MNDLTHKLAWEGRAYAAVALVGLAALVGLYLFAPGLRRRWLPVPRLRPGAWGGHEVFLAFCVFFGFQNLIVVFLELIGFFGPLIGPAPDADAPADKQSIYLFRCLYVSSPLTLAIILGLIFALMYARTGSRPHHFGLTWSRWPANSALGIAAFLVGRPLVIGIFVLALLVYPQRPDVITKVVDKNLPSWEWALLAFQTIVMAPVLEEILCRGILMGWLRRATLAGHVALLFMTLTLTALLNASDLIRYDFSSLAFVALLVIGHGYALYRIKQRFELNEEEMQEWKLLPTPLSLDGSVVASEEEARATRQQLRGLDQQRFARFAEVNANLAIFGSAILFAAIHANWPGPVALFPMGLLLGWLCRRTQSLVGPIVFHALFNLATFISLYGSALTAP